MSYGVTLRCVHHIWLQSIRGRTVTTKSCLAAVRMWPTSAQSCGILARQLNLIHPLIIFAHLVQYRSDICNFPYVWRIVLLVLFLVGACEPVASVYKLCFRWAIRARAQATCICDMVPEAKQYTDVHGYLPVLLLELTPTLSRASFLLLLRGHCRRGRFAFRSWEYQALKR